MNGTPYDDAEKTAIGTVEIDERTQVVSASQGNATQYAANVECPVCHTGNPPSETYCMDCGFELSGEPVAVEDIPEIAPAGTLVTPDGLREFALRQGENTIGRENADILLSHNTVSRRHGKIIVQDGRALVQDLGSTNGTFVDGRRIEGDEQVELKDEVDVVFGSVTLKYQASEGQGAEHETAPGADEPEVTVQVDAADAEPEEMEQTEQIEEPGEEQPRPESVGRLVSTDGAYSLDISSGVNRIGRRAGDNEIVIPDPYCSGRHADLLAENGSFTLTDIGSTNGTMVNGVKLNAGAPRELQPGDEITVGRIVFRIEVESDERS